MSPFAHITSDVIAEKICKLMGDFVSLEGMCARPERLMTKISVGKLIRVKGSLVCAKA